MLGFELWLHHLQDIILVTSVPSFSICKLRILIASAYWCVYQQSGFIKRAESIEVVSTKGFVRWIQPVKLWEMLGNWRMERRVQISKQELPVNLKSHLFQQWKWGWDLEFGGSMGTYCLYVVFASVGPQPGSGWSLELLLVSRFKSWEDNLSGGWRQWGHSRIHWAILCLACLGIKKIPWK